MTNDWIKCNIETVFTNNLLVEGLIKLSHVITFIFIVAL